MTERLINFINEQLNKGYSWSVTREDYFVLAYRVTITDNKKSKKVQFVITDVQLAYQKDDCVLFGLFQEAMYKLEHL